MCEKSVKTGHFSLVFHMVFHIHTPSSVWHWRVASREEPANNQFPAIQGMLHQKSTFGKAVDVTLKRDNL